MRKHHGIVIAALIAAAAVMAPAGCGGSDKPQYCSDRSNLEQSVKDLGNVKLLASGGVEQLQSQLAKVESDARALSSSAKSDFPSESNAIQSSVSTLKTALQGLPSSPTPQQLTGVVADVKAVGTAIQNFDEATDSKCS
jgi:hypothetical protein